MLGKKEEKKLLTKQNLYGGKELIEKVNKSQNIKRTLEVL